MENNKDIKEIMWLRVKPYIRHKRIKLDLISILKDTGIRELEQRNFNYQLGEHLKGHEKKTVLIKSLYNELQDVSYLRKLLINYSEKGLERLDELLNANFLINEDEYYHYLPMIEDGLAYIYVENGSYLLFIPKEIKEVIHKVLNGHFNGSTFEKLYKLYNEMFSFMKAAVSLYGVISLDELQQMCGKYQKFNAYTYEELIEIVETGLLGVNNFERYKDYLVDVSYYELDELFEIDDLVASRGMNRHHIADLDVFMLYADETKSEDINGTIERMADFLHQHRMDKSLEEAYEATYEVVDHIRYDMIDMIDYNLDRMGYEFNETYSEFLDCLLDLANNTRLWELYGHTRLEMSREWTSIPRFFGEEDELDFDIPLEDYDWDSHIYMPIHNKIPLKTALIRLTNDERKQLRKRYGVLAKEIDIKLIPTYLDYLKSCTSEALDLLVQIIEADGTLPLEECINYVSSKEDLYSLPIKLLVFPGVDKEEQPVLNLPYDVAQALKNIDWKVYYKSARSNDTMLEVLIGFCKVYGIIYHEQAIRQLKMYFSLEGSDEKILKMIKQLIDLVDAIDYNDKLFYLSSVIEPEVLAENINSRSDIIQKRYKKSELLKISKADFYHKGHHMKDFRHFLRSETDVPEQDIDQLCGYISDAFEMSDPFGDVVSNVLELFNVDDLDFMNFITSMLKNIHNETPQWQLKGHSPNNLRTTEINEKPVNILAMNEEKVVDFQSMKKVGRNDPCPCGSGRKYKHCCGK